MYGHKRVRERCQDALTRVGREQLEVLLAIWYRGHGYDVEHTGTGASGSKYDGGIDLKLRRPGEYLSVQVKHWNAYKVPQNDVHQLLGLMLNEGATGAILVTSGEFSKAAIETATRHGRVRLSTTTSCARCSARCRNRGRRDSLVGSLPHRMRNVLATPSATYSSRS